MSDSYREKKDMGTTGFGPSVGDGYERFEQVIAQREYDYYLSLNGDGGKYEC